MSVFCILCSANPRAAPRSHAAGPSGLGDRPGVSPGLGVCSSGSGKCAELLLPGCLGGVFPDPAWEPRTLVPTSVAGDKVVSTLHSGGCGFEPSVRQRGCSTCAASEGAGSREALAALLAALCGET